MTDLAHMQELINSVCIECKEFLEIADYASVRDSEHMLKLCIIGNNLKAKFDEFEHKHISERIKAPEKPIIVTYTYFLPDHLNELNLVRLSNEFFCGLWDIQNYCRDVLRNGTNLSLIEFAEKINTRCWDTDLHAIN